MAILFGVLDFCEKLDTRNSFNSIKEFYNDFEFEYSHDFVTRKYCLGCLNKKDKRISNHNQNYIVYLSGSIDNKEELIKSLKFDEGISDEKFILEILRSKGDSFFGLIQGDWFVSIWDKEDQELFLANSCSGNSGMFYFYKDKVFTYCSTLPGLLNSESINRELNLNYIENYLLDIIDESNDSPFKNIFFIPASSFLKINKRDCFLTEYWNPLNIKESKSVDFNDVFKLLKKSTKKIIDVYDVIGSTISGGLDSSSVSVIAANILLEKKTKLQSYTSSPQLVHEKPSKDYFYNEHDYTKLISEFNSNIELHNVFGNDSTVIEALEEGIKIHGYPIHAPINSHWFYEIYKQSKLDGVKVLLNGQMGNLTLSWDGKKDKHSLLSIMKDFVNLVLLFFGFKRIKTSFDIFSNPILNRSAVKKIRKDLLFWILFKYKRGIEQRCYLFRNSCRMSGNIWQDLSIYFGVDSKDPTSDKKIIELCLSIPDNKFYNSKNDRLLIREIMNGLLPNEVRMNKARGVQGIDSWGRLIRDRELILSSFEKWRNNDSITSVVNITELEKKFSKIVTSITINDYFRDGHQLMRAISLCVFIEYYKINNSLM